MVRPIVHDPLFLAQKSEPATAEDLQVLIDTAKRLGKNHRPQHTLQQWRRNVKAVQS